MLTANSANQRFTTSPARLLVVWLMFALPSLATAEDRVAAPPSAPADPTVYGIELDKSDTDHWSYLPIIDPPPPAVRNVGWLANPLDAFILSKLEAQNLSPSARAQPSVWLRRVTFDLTGLPPTPDELQEFLADASPEARERVVDRLLASPTYGIRWGRRWLDVVRFAETNGYERDGPKSQAWRYRDWVVESLNADKPFDRFLTEQLAGDELEDQTAQTLIATTFLRLGTWDDEPADPLVDRCEQLDDIVGTTASTFMGLTVRCARCHNHKFEPFSQIDYARMVAIFDPLKRPQADRADLDVPVGTRRELADFDSASARHQNAIKAVEDQLAALDVQIRLRYLASDRCKLTSEAKAAHQSPADQRTDAQKKLVKETQTQLDVELQLSRTSDEQRQRDAFQASIAALGNAAPTPLPRAYIWREPAGSPPVTHVLRRGNPLTPAGVVEPGFLTVLASTHTPLLPAEPGRTSRRRLSLARWLTDDKQPLTARVIVNRLWQGHFGNGLVGTENDFGVMGESPSHPELLDWLASRLKESGWRMKPLHRLIVLSRAYAQSSAANASAARVDVDNRLLWRFPYRRLEAEAIRDAVLSVSGQLNPQMSGPSVYPKIAREILEGQSRPGDGWGKSDESQSSRRSVYVYVKRSLLVPEMELLDLADTTASCEQRSVSTIPTQALTFLNGDFLNAQSRHFAARLQREAGADQRAVVERGYQLALNRSASPAEIQTALTFLDRQRALAEADKHANPSSAALEAWCQIVLNLNEFVYVD